MKGKKQVLPDKNTKSAAIPNQKNGLNQFWQDMKGAKLNILSSIDDKSETKE